MSADSLAAAQNLFRIWNTRDFEALIPYVADDVEWRPATQAAVEGGSFKGHEGLRTFFAEWDETWATWEVEVQDVREIGDRVLTLGHVKAKARESGLELDQPAAYLFEFRDGLLARGATFFDHGEALQAAGAEEAA